MSWGADQLSMTEETFALAKAATAGIDTTTAIAGIDLLDDIMSWVPVDTPFFNSCPRGQGKGAVAVFWQTLLNINNQQNYRATPANESAAVVKVQNQYTFSPYQAIGSGGFVSWDAIAQGEDQADVLAVDTLQTINQQLIKLEIHQLNALSFALPTIGTPTVVGNSTGGSIAAANYDVGVAARSNYNWYVGGSGVLSTTAEATVGGSGNGSISASVAPVEMAAGYDWWVGDHSGTLYYYGTTVGPSITITSIPGSNNDVTTGLAGLYGAGASYTNPISGVNTKPTTDTSYESSCINGLLASILGDWAASPDGPVPGSETGYLVTPGSGTSQAAYYSNLAGSPLTVQGAGFVEIDAMNKSIYDTYNVSVSRMLMGSQTITDFANAFLDNPQAVTWLSPDARDGRLSAVMGGHVATYANKTVNGEPIELWLMPYLPPGQIISVIDSLPFPGSNVTSALQARTQYDFFRFDYGAQRGATNDGSNNTGPRYDFEIRSRMALVNKAAGIMGCLMGIGAGIG